MTTTALTLISSMATKQVLAELIALYRHTLGAAAPAIELTSVGGVDAAKRIAAGEPFDGVVLGSDALDKLIASGHVLADSRVDIVRSGVAVAVPAGAPHPDLSREESVKQAVLAARTLGYSTGPSGVALAKLFERWGIAEQIAPRIITPAAGRAGGLAHRQWGGGAGISAAERVDAPGRHRGGGAAASRDSD
jgi:molybdate transport system substrate-binding protein